MKDMLGRNDAIKSTDALAFLFDSLRSRTLRGIKIGIEEALGRIAAEDIYSSENLPSFDRSTVDGYAVHAADTYGATESMPAYLTLSGEVLMGSKADFDLPRGGAAKIPTGGMLPRQSDAVVMFEHTESSDSSMIEVLKPVASGENVIIAGDDMGAGEIVIKKGTRIRPPHIGALAGIGITQIIVHGIPVVSIISTGDEIVPAKEDLRPGQIRDTNSYVIAAMVSDAGGLPRRLGIFRDDYDEIRNAVENAMKTSDIIAVSGGTSVGTKDMIARIISDIGNPGILFHGVAIKPGKPVIGGVINNVPIFGLPGHPAAVVVCFEVFIKPVLRLLSGAGSSQDDMLKGTVRARIARNISSSQGRDEYVRVTLEERADGLWAVPLLGKSGLIRTLVNATGTIMIPSSLNGLEKGEVVDVRLL